MKYSVIIPVKDDINIYTALDSYVQAIKAVEVECIIVFNGAKEDFIRDIKNKYSRNIRIAVTRVGNISLARNIGVLVAKGVYVVHIDSDSIIPVDYFEILESIIDKQDIIKGNLEFAIDDKFTKDQAWFHAYVNSKSFTKHVFTPNLVVKKSLYKQIGGYDPLMTGSEDGDWSDRILEFNFKIKFSKELTLYNSYERRGHKVKSWRLYGFGGAYRHVRNVKINKKFVLTLVPKYLDIWKLIFDKDMPIGKRLFVTNFIFHFTLGYIVGIKKFVKKDIAFFNSRYDAVKLANYKNSYYLLD